MKILFTFCTILFSFFASAKNPAELSGRVTSGGAPVAGAAIYLYKDTGTVIVKTTLTDAVGAFEFGTALEKYRIKVVAAGYEELISDVLIKGQPVELKLAAQVKEIQGVTVSSQRRMIEVKTDKTVLNVEASPSNIGTNALEVLEKAPGITVDKDGNISMQGKSGVMILIDGKPTYMSNADVANYLKSLSSAQLDQIELITQPSAKYDASGNAGIINIRTKTNKLFGLNGSLGLGYSQGVYARGNANGTIGYRKGKWNTFANLSYNRNRTFNDMFLIRNFRAKADNSLLSVMDQKSSMLINGAPVNLKFSIDYLASKRTTVGLNVSGFYNDAKFVLPTDMFVYNGSGLHTGNYNTLTQNNMINKNISTNLNFRTRLDTLGKELGADVDYVHYQSDFIQSMDNYFIPANGSPAEDPYLLKGTNPSNIDIYSAKLDYTHPLKNNAKIEAGLKTSIVETNSDSRFTYLNGTVWEKDPRSNHFIYKENINAAYLNLNKQWSKWGAQFGLRLENTIMKGNQVTINQQFDRNLTQLFPTVFLSYKYSDKHSYTINAGRRIQRPNYKDLNPFQLILNPFTYNQGNPNLRPQFTWNIELGHSYNNGMLTTKLSYSKTTDIITDVLRQIDSTKVSYVQTENIASSENWNLSMAFNKSLTKAISTSLYGSVFNNKYDGFFNGAPLKENFTSFSFNMNNQFKLGKGWSAELSGFYNHKNLIVGQSFIGPMWALTTGISKQVLKNKGTIRLSVRDVLLTQKVNIDQRFQNLDSKFRQVFDSRVFSLNFTWRFAKNEKNVVRSRQNSASQEEQNRAGGQQ